MSGHVLGIWLTRCEGNHSSCKFTSPWEAWKVDIPDTVVLVLGSCVSFSWFCLRIKCMGPSAVSAAMAVSWAWEDSCDLAISIALSSVNLAPFEINFSLTLSEFVSKTTRSLITSSGSQPWAWISSDLMNFYAVSMLILGLDSGIWICRIADLLCDLRDSQNVRSMFLISYGHRRRCQTTCCRYPFHLTDPVEQIAAFLLFCSRFERFWKHHLDVLLETPPVFVQVVNFPLHNWALVAA